MIDLSGLTQRKARVTRIKMNSDTVKQILRERQGQPKAATPAASSVTHSPTPTVAAKNGATAEPQSMMLPMLVAWGVGVATAYALLKNRS